MREIARDNPVRQCLRRGQRDRESLGVFAYAVVPDGEQDILCLQSTVTGEGKGAIGGNGDRAFGGAGGDGAEGGVFTDVEINVIAVVINAGKSNVKDKFPGSCERPEFNRQSDGIRRFTRRCGKPRDKTDAVVVVDDGEGVCTITELPITRQSTRHRHGDGDLSLHFGNPVFGDGQRNIQRGAGTRESVRNRKRSKSVIARHGDLYARIRQVGGIRHTRTQTDGAALGNPVVRSLGTPESDDVGRVDGDFTGCVAGNAPAGRQHHPGKIEREGFVGINAGEGRDSERHLALLRRHPPVVVVDGCADGSLRNRETVFAASSQISACLRDSDEGVSACGHRPVDCRGNDCAFRFLVKDKDRGRRLAKGDGVVVGKNVNNVRCLAPVKGEVRGNSVVAVGNPQENGLADFGSGIVKDFNDEVRVSRIRNLEGCGNGEVRASHRGGLFADDIDRKAEGSYRSRGNRDGNRMHCNALALNDVRFRRCKTDRSRRSVIIYDGKPMRPARGAAREARRHGQRDRERLGNFGDGILRGGNIKLHKVIVRENRRLAAAAGNVAGSIRNIPSQRNGSAAVAAGNLNPQRYRIALLNSRRVVRSKRHRPGDRVLNRQLKIGGGKTPAYQVYLGMEFGTFGESNRVLVLVVIPVRGETETHLRLTRFRGRRYRVDAINGIPVVRFIPRSRRVVRRRNGKTRRRVNAYRQGGFVLLVQQKGQFVMSRRFQNPGHRRREADAPVVRGNGE